MISTNVNPVFPDAGSFINLVFRPLERMNLPLGDPQPGEVIRPPPDADYTNT